MEVLTCSRGGRLESDRGRVLFTQLPDEVDYAARWRGTWEPLADIKGWWHDSRTRNTCCIRTGSASWELFCLERGIQPEIGVGADAVNADFNETDVGKTLPGYTVAGLVLLVVHDTHI